MEAGVIDSHAIFFCTVGNPAEIERDVVTCPFSKLVQNPTLEGIFRIWLEMLQSGADIQLQRASGCGWRANAMPFPHSSPISSARSFKLVIGWESFLLKNVQIL